MKLIVLALCIAVASAGCPNACSGHGTCDSQDTCTCYLEVDGNNNMWTGADCSKYTCPRGTSWSYPVSESKFEHQADRECSDMGLCDRATGECACFAGYEGSSCQRTKCPNACSGHGTCRSNKDFALDFSEAIFKQQKQNAATTNFYDYFLAQYNDAWDSDMNFGCLCDIGYRGADCSLIECPTYMDPMDENLCDQYAHFTSKATGNTVSSLQWNADRHTGQKVGYYNPIYFYNNISKGYPCSGASSGDSCSARGTCDYTTGVCKCFSGFSGPDCGDVQQLG